MRATGWRFLPYAGGLLDQPEWIMHDLIELTAEHNRLEKELEG